jgi:hypothetical protein
MCRVDTCAYVHVWVCRLAAQEIDSCRCVGSCVDGSVAVSVLVTVLMVVLATVLLLLCRCL